jgi:hypothetical protein
MAHCNGWPGDHRGALPYVEWVEVPDKPATAKPAKQELWTNCYSGARRNRAQTPLAN